MSICSLNTYKELLEFLTEKLSKSQAEWILCEVFNLSKADIYLNFNEKVDPKYKVQISEVFQRCLTDEPLQYIFGKNSFYGLDIFVGEGVLIPRQETEVLVENALTLLEDNDRVLDLCTGSGAIAIALYSQKKSLQVTASDISPQALTFAKKNIHYHQAKIKLVCSNLFDNITLEKFSLIVANPPYIATNLYNSLDKKILNFEPELALHSGLDGLDLIRRIIADAKQYLKNGGYLLLEVCSTHIAKVQALFEQSHYEEVTIIMDYTQRQRFVQGKHIL